MVINGLNGHFKFGCARLLLNNGFQESLSGYQTREVYCIVPISPNEQEPCIDAWLKVNLCDRVT